MNLQAIINP